MKKRLKIRYLVRLSFLILSLFYCKNIRPAQNNLGPNVQLTNGSATGLSKLSKNSKAGSKDLAKNKAIEKNNKKDKSSNDKKNGSDIYLNFDNVTLSSVVYYLSEQKKINIIPHKELDNLKVSLTTRNPLTLERAWNVLLTLLEMNNFSIINVGGLYRIVKNDQNKQEPLPIYSSGMGVEPESLPESDLVIRYIYFLKNITAEMAKSFLSTMLSGSVEINNDLDVCIITDKSLSIKSAMKIVKELDQGGLREAIKTISLKYADAQDVSRLFEQIIPKDGAKNIRFIGAKSKKTATFFSSSTKIIPEPRKNSLIILGLEKNIDKIIGFVRKYIDVPIKAADSRLHIKELKYAKAENLKPLLTDIIKPPTGVSKTKQMGEFRFFEDVLIAADSSQGNEGQGGGNRLIIACNKQDWIRLERFINAIDKPQPQVAFEVLVADVSIKSNNELWAQFKPRKDFVIGKGVNPFFETAYASKDINLGTPDATTGIISTESPQTNLTFGKLIKDPITQIETMNLWGIVKAVLGKDNFSIITQPYLVTNNNQECFIDDTSTREVPGEFSSKTLASSLVRLRKSQDAKTLVRLTPKINLNGTMELKIRVEISNFQTTEADNPDRNTRNLETKVSVGTGEVLILGGLTRSNIQENSYKVPILGDIPLLGNLFKSKTKFKEKTNLYVFIRPSIIKPEMKGVPDEYTQMKLDYAKYQILGAETYSKEKDPIQRWFFRPSKQSAKDKLEDSKKGIFRPIDNYAQGAQFPVSVDIKNDTYFRPASVSKKMLEEKKIKEAKINGLPQFRLKRRKKA